MILSVLIILSLSYCTVFASNNNLADDFKDETKVAYTNIEQSI